MTEKGKKGLADDALDLFDELIQIHRPPAMALAFNILGNREDAEDACQETFISVFRNRSSLPLPSDLKKWLFTILYRKCLDILRRRKRAVRIVWKIRSENPAQLFRTDDPAGKKPKNRSISLSEPMLKALSEKERACLSLWANEDYSAEEIAGILSCAAATVRVHLFRARRKLKTLMEKDHASL